MAAKNFRGETNVFSKFRRWLAVKIAPKDFYSLGVLANGYAMKAFVQWREHVSPASNSLCWTTFTVDASYDLRLTKYENEPRMLCEICTHRFDANPDRPAACPSCGSEKVMLT